MSSKENNNINITSLKNLKFFEGYAVVFLLLDSPLLEELTLKYEITPNEQKKVIEKSCSLKLLKTIYFEYKINNEIISKIECKNNSITEIHTSISNEKKKNHIPLQNIFPNLSDLYIYPYRSLSEPEEKEPIYEIIENPDCEIKNINMQNYESSFKFYCHYEKLESINFNITNRKMNFSKFFPIFSDICNTIFKSLKFFKLVTFKNIINLNNMLNNIDNMPNLIEFSLYYSTSVNINAELLKRFIRKILTMKFIKRININITKDDPKEKDIEPSIKKYEKYSKNKLKKIFPDINFDNFYEINICKFKIGVTDACKIF